MNKPNKTELEYFIRYSLDSDKYKRYIELYSEIERLNNIINEFEKWLEEESNFWKEQQEKAIKLGWLEFGGKYNTTVIYENAINKLQELKGVDKE